MITIRRAGAYSNKHTRLNTRVSKKGKAYNKRSK